MLKITQENLELAFKITVKRESILSDCNYEQVEYFENYVVPSLITKMENLFSTQMALAYTASQLLGDDDLSNNVQDLLTQYYLNEASEWVDDAELVFERSNKLANLDKSISLKVEL